ncbi:MFS transporter [Sulfurifustis variabilis]|uniref:MFS transporter n=1 Tax=Sulfurifustis variabilis TaxID=1675686 RepID=A0A1B4V872_9GAMM|nr:MFS transporter [Sulfurifustis variabilis]BAU49729.1 MFS transporter [Sulfurifustis variabilis]
MSAPWAAGGRVAAGLRLPLAAVFVVSVAYAVVLPVLPFLLERSLGEGARAAVAWHTGLLTGVYMLALFVAAPAWGHSSDRIGRRRVILIGLVGLSGALLLLALGRGLALAYSARLLAGAFAGAVLPATYAYVSDASTPADRAQAFAALSAAAAIGFLLAPGVSGWLASVQTSVVDPLALPFYASAALSAAVALAARRSFATTASRGGRPDGEAAAPSLNRLLALSLLVMLGIGSFEVALVLTGQQVLRLGPRAIGFVFAECSLVMVLVQLFVLGPLIRRGRAQALLAPAFLAMALGLGLLPYGQDYRLLLVATALIAAASGLLIPALVYLVSLAAGAAQGAALGRETAAASLGQAAGSAGAGWLFALLVEAPYWVTAGLLVIAAILALKPYPIRLEGGKP